MIKSFACDAGVQESRVVVYACATLARKVLRFHARTKCTYIYACAPRTAPLFNVYFQVIMFVRF